jgi:hypothetical protein
LEFLLNFPDGLLVALTGTRGTELYFALTFGLWLRGSGEVGCRRDAAIVAGNGFQDLGSEGQSRRDFIPRRESDFVNARQILRFDHGYDEARTFHPNRQGHQPGSKSLWDRF